MKKWAQQTKGFTIVELLIVIVVIGILAAITIVSFNGVQNRAKTVTVQSDVENAAKSLEHYKLTMNATEQYPATQAAANLKISGSNSATYIYKSTNNSYCLTVTNGSTSYYTTSDTKSSLVGTCGGDGLIGWWALNGNANDQTDNGINGNITGSTSVTGQNGVANNAYAFSGTSQYISLGSSAKLNSSEVTFSAWVKTTNPALVQDIIAKESQYKYRISGTGVGVLVAAAGTSWTKNYNASYSFAANTWYHVVATISSAKNNSSVYVNGALVLSTDISGMPITAYSSIPMYIGAHNTSIDMFSGAIDDVRMYSRALSAAEIQGLYDNGAQ